MTVTVLFFASLQAVVGEKALELELPQGATVADLIACLEADYPRLAEFRTYRVAVGQEFASTDQPVPDGSEVALLPPVSGGSEADLVRLTREPVSVDQCLEAVRRRDCGAVVLFLGTVRDQTQGQPVERLEYSAYEPMALKQLQGLAVTLREKFTVGSVALWHRIGDLPPGEISVAVAVSSAHREQAFEAGRWAIDTLKSTVPLWKKEVGPEGAVWIEGDARTPATVSPATS